MLELDLIVFLAYLVVTGSAAAAMAHAKATTGWMPKWLKAAVFFAIPAAEFAVKIARFLTHHFGGFASALDAKVAKFFGQLAHYQFVVGYWSLYWPVGLYHFAEHLYKHSIPNAINARVKPLTKRIDATEAQAKANAGVAHSTTKIVKANSKTVEVTRIERVAMPHAAEWDWVHEHFGTLKKAVAAAAAGAIGIALPHAPSFPVPWRGQIKSLKKRLTKVEAIAGITGLAAILAGLLGVSKGCLGGNGNLGKAARRICGLDSSLLDALLLGTALLAGPLSVVEFAGAMRDVEDEFVVVLKAGIKELQGL